MDICLGALAAQLGVVLRGDPNIIISRVAQFADADANSLVFFNTAKYHSALQTTQAGAVILAEAHADAVSIPVLFSANPYLTFARAAQLLHPNPPVLGGIHSSAVIDSTAHIDPSAHIGALVVIAEHVMIGARTVIGPGCVIGADVRIGADSRLIANVTLCTGTIIGERALIHPGAVIGREGFGFAHDGEQWVHIPQIGRAILGDDVEVGANTAIDRGTIGDTRIGTGVKLDNHIQIAHNVEIGAHTAIAGNCGIAGSTRIGRHCTIAGAVGIAGHLEIGDHVHFTGMAMVTHSIRQPGSYSSGIPAIPTAQWRRNAVRFKHIDDMMRQLKVIETWIETMKEMLTRGKS
jgi:UDP-3-O-[3-hydroxymyristoyl] glucosamine N-acyltransferase